MITVTDVNKTLEELQELQNEARALSNAKPRTSYDKQAISSKIQSIQRRMELALHRIAGLESLQV